MSSKPFNMGLQVLDNPPAQTGMWVIRADNRQNLFNKVRRLVDVMPQDVVVLLRDIGYRPDKPVPIAKYFAVVRVVLADQYPDKWMADGWMEKFKGRRKAVMIYDE